MTDRIDTNPSGLGVSRTPRSIGGYNMSNRYRKKPVVIEAFQMTQQRREDNRDWPAWLNEAWQVGQGPGGCWPSDYPNSDGADEIMIGTLEGDHRVSWGDWIIRGVKGEIYPCKPDIFHATYEPEESS